MCSHENPGSTVRSGTLSSQALDLAAIVDLVELEDSELDLLLLVLDLLWSGVILLLTLLASAPQTKHEVESGLFLDVVVGESAAIFQLLPSKNQTLLIGRDT